MKNLWWVTSGGRRIGHPFSELLLHTKTQKKKEQSSRDVKPNPCFLGCLDTEVLLTPLASAEPQQNLSATAMLEMTPLKSQPALKPVGFVFSFTSRAMIYQSRCQPLFCWNCKYRCFSAFPKERTAAASYPSTLLVLSTGRPWVLLQPVLLRRSAGSLWAPGGSSGWATAHN